MLRLHGNSCRRMMTRRRQRFLNDSSIMHYYSCNYNGYATMATTVVSRIVTQEELLQQKKKQHQQHHFEQQQHQQPYQHNNLLARRHYYCSPTTIKMSEKAEREELGDGGGAASGGGDKKKRVEKEVDLNKLYARDYNNRRAAYNRQVSALRRQYFKEYQEQLEKDEARRQKEAEEVRRSKLIRQRAKNLRSVRNMKKQERMRQEAHEKFQRHLDEVSKRRQIREGRLKKAREMIIRELEEEAPLWLTTNREVEDAFNDHRQQQYLWSRPTGSGILGAVNPSVDSHFWRQYESHTWHMDKTYETQRELLLQELLDDCYYRGNIDDQFWNQKDDDDDDNTNDEQDSPGQDRLTKRLELEHKAKLRAMVRMEGRKSLLQKQRDILQDLYGTTKDEVPKVMPAPNVNILANIEEQEREGVQILLNDPTKFFKFSSMEQQQQQPLLQQGSDDDGDNEKQQQMNTTLTTDDNVYAGPTLGKPSGLRDWLRESMGGDFTDEDNTSAMMNSSITTSVNSNHVHAKKDKVFPQGIAKMEKPDTRTPAQKKRAEREEKMWAAARKEKYQQETENDGNLSIELAANQMSLAHLEEPLDYDENEKEWDKEDYDEWLKGLNVERDSDIILGTPHERRFKKEDIEWVIKQMDRKIVYLNTQLMQQVSSTRHKLEARESRSEFGKRDDDDFGEEVSELDKELLKLTDEQVLALYNINDMIAEMQKEDEAAAASSSESSDKDSSAVSSSNSKRNEKKLLEALKKVPGLTEERVKDILQIQIVDDDGNDSGDNN